MEEMEEEPPTPASPFWLSSRSTHQNPLLSTGLHLAVLSIVAILLMAVVTPSLLSQAQQVFRPSSIKRGWDSINIVLVAFAIICGILGRKEDNKGNEDVEGSKDRSPQYVRSRDQYNWHSYGDEGNVARLSSLRRASSSYPDLIRQETMWDAEYDPRPRYYDDSNYVNQYKSPTLVVRSAVEDFRSQKLNGYDNCKEEKDGCEDDVKVIEIDHSVRMNAPKESPPPPPEARKGSGKGYESNGRRVRRDVQGRKKLEARENQSPSPSPESSSTVSTATKMASRQEYESINRHRVKTEGEGRRKLESKESQSANAPPPPPPPPPESSQKKRSGTTKEIITSIYQQSKRKKKKQNRRSYENLENLIPSNPNPLFPPPSPPPPPPPPPPPSFFHNIFSSKKVKSGKKSPPHPPPSTTNRRKFDLIIDQIGVNGSESPLIPIPPPPPPPPFKVPSWKFVVQGDYVKINGSPLRDDDSEANTPTPSPLFFPSPDVNMKADDFIARFRAKLKLEKMNSIKHQRILGTSFSPLGPDYSPSPT